MNKTSKAPFNIPSENENRKRIESAWHMSYCAVLKDNGKEYTVIHIDNKGAVLINDGAVGLPVWDQVGKMEIVGYKYAGDLAGSEQVPEGQKFRVKETEEEIEYGFMERGRIVEKAEYNQRDFDKSELEPVFE